MWDDWKIDTVYHVHGHAFFSVTLDQVAGIDIFPYSCKPTVVWGINPLDVFRVTHAVRPQANHARYCPLLRKVLGTSQTQLLTA